MVFPRGRRRPCARACAGGGKPPAQRPRWVGAHGRAPASFAASMARRFLPLAERSSTAAVRLAKCRPWHRRRRSPDRVEHLFPCPTPSRVPYPISFIGLMRLLRDARPQPHGRRRDGGFISAVPPSARRGVASPPRLDAKRGRVGMRSARSAKPSHGAGLRTFCRPGLRSLLRSRHAGIGCGPRAAFCPDFGSPCQAGLRISGRRDRCRRACTAHAACPFRTSFQTVALLAHEGRDGARGPGIERAGRVADARFDPRIGVHLVPPWFQRRQSRRTARRFLRSRALDQAA